MNRKIQNAFDDVHAEARLQRDTMAFLQKKMRSREARKPRFSRRLAVALTCIALMTLGLGGYAAYFQQTSAISIDINPSIELGVNRFGRVISVAAYSNDGETIASSAQVKYKDYVNALDALFESDEMQPFLQSDARISITVASITDDESEAMLARISSCGSPWARRAQCRLGNREEVEAAHSCGMSFGKYRAFLELQALDPKTTVEEVREMTMRQIRIRIRELAGGTDGARRGNGFGGNGAGYGNGKGRISREEE